MFNLHPQLATDGIVLGDFKLCRLLLINDVQFPWFVLVPRRENVTEIYQLTADDRGQLLHESCVLAQALQEGFVADKLNIAVLGNMVSQLHIHHIVRYQNDLAWPAPVWGKVPASAYSTTQLSECVAKLKTRLTTDIVYAERFK